MGIPMPTGTGLFKLVQDLGGCGVGPGTVGAAIAAAGQPQQLPLRPAPLLAY